MNEVFLVGGARTPMGRYGGVLAGVRPDDLAALVVAEAVRRGGLGHAAVDEVILGAANQAGEDNRNVARMAVLLSGLPATVPGYTVNRLCASGLTAVISAAQAVRAGEADLVVAGGVESMTRAPWVMAKPGTPWAKPGEVADTSLGWRLVNPRFSRPATLSMGETAEEVAALDGITREESDAWALRSHERAVAAAKDGRFAAEIVGVPVSGKRKPIGSTGSPPTAPALPAPGSGTSTAGSGTSTAGSGTSAPGSGTSVTWSGTPAPGSETSAAGSGASAPGSETSAAGSGAPSAVFRGVAPAFSGAGEAVVLDEGPRADTTLERLGRLKTIFRDQGIVTAGSSSPLSDGAAALVVASAAAVERYGLTPRARIVTGASAGVEPHLMGLGPVPATQKALARAGWTGVDTVEINEAFAPQVLACVRRLGLDPETVNADGGAIALGHPLGCSGARLVVTLLGRMEREGARRGLAALCVGVGQGVAMLVERL
ncbi:beta-ketoacyl synthase N-terminal-like domain-containing protein [Nonomuraea typhae]|uniref:Probable acetyl-CoA acetyltransferase n=1 Tax=Nonomuraea typhae TaxID=2603600 RepID=A0ABW7YL29_9ACTN